MRLAPVGCVCGPAAGRVAVKLRRVRKDPPARIRRSPCPCSTAVIGAGERVQDDDVGRACTTEVGGCGTMSTVSRAGACRFLNRPKARDSPLNGARDDQCGVAQHRLELVARNSGKGGGGGVRNAAAVGVGGGGGGQPSTRCASAASAQQCQCPCVKTSGSPCFVHHAHMLPCTGGSS